MGGELTCPAPEFAQIAHGVWGACLRCQRLAWDHEQADPLADIRNFRQRRDFSAPPVMLTEDQWRARELRRAARRAVAQESARVDDPTLLIHPEHLAELGESDG